MASVNLEKNGTWRVQFTGADDRRQTLRIGKCSKRDAELVRCRVELLLAAQILGTSPEPDTLRWVASLDSKLKNRLARVGLIRGVEIPRASKKVTLHQFVTQYIADRSKSVKPATVEIWKTASDSMIKSLGKILTLHQVNAAHAQQWIDQMRADGLKPTTIHKRVQFGKQFLHHAVASKLLASDPWATVKVTRPKGVSNVEVTRKTIDSLMLTLDPKWQAIVGLARYGGLRCPSEVLSLRWEHIDWEKSAMTIPSPKTEHLSGQATRICPLFRELRKILEPMRREEGFVVDDANMRSKADTHTGWKNINLRSLLLDRLKAAGIKPWSRLFHSMRASRQTELEREFGLAAACAWMGNTQSVAKSHYLLITSDIFKKAT